MKREKTVKTNQQKGRLVFISFFVLFFMLFILSVDYSICTSWNSMSSVWKVYKIVVPSFFLILSILAVIFIVILKYKLKGVHDKPVKIKTIENESLEYLTFFMSYLLPLIGYSTDSISADEKDADAIVSLDVDRHPDELDPFITFDTSIRITDRVVFNFSNDSLNDIRGFIIEIGNQEASIVLYKKHYPMMLMRRDLLLGVYKSKERFEKLPEADVLKISGSFQLLRVGNDCFVTDRKMLDLIMSDEVFRQDRIKESIEAIKSLNVIEDIDQLAAEGDATITRKLFGIATNSPVIKKGITAERLIKYTQTTGIFNNRFHYSEDGKRIRLDTKASRIAFLKLLNDAFLRSELTDDYYEARAKEKMD